MDLSSPSLAAEPHFDWLIDEREVSIIPIKQSRQRVLGAAVVLSCVGIGFCLAMLQHKTQAQRAEAQGYALSAPEGEHLIRGGGNILIKADPSRGANSMALGTQQIPVGGRIPIHRHAQMDEAFYVVEGNGTFILNDARLTVDKGAMIFIPKGAWHGFDKSDKEMLLLWLVVPPGLEGLFREIASRPGEPPKRLIRNESCNISRSFVIPAKAGIQSLPLA